MAQSEEQARWARVLQALWLVAAATAKVRGGAYETLLIPGVTDSAQLTLGKNGIRSILGSLYAIEQESPRRREEVEALLFAADSKVRWFIEADPSTLALAGSGSLAAGAELMEELARLTLDSGLRKHLTALEETFRLLSQIEPYTANEAQEISRLRQASANHPLDLGIKGELFDLESQ